MVYMPAVVIITHYFDAKLGLATGETEYNFLFANVYDHKWTFSNINVGDVIESTHSHRERKKSNPLTCLVKDFVIS